ncbi:MAG TPA: hypothetical protein DCM68_01315 [Verrucomicrobia bacterium]|nr:hypothetical protein [Verrucomicrobiota bacterium]
MIARRLPALRFATWIQVCGLFFIGGGMALALGAASVNFFGQTLSDPSAGSILLGMAAYLAVAIAGVAGLRKIHRHGGVRAFLWTALAVSMLIQLAAILASDRHWEWTGDAHIFQHYLDRLSESGYSAETLGELSQNYDYPIWTRRALPFYYALRMGTGDHFGLAVQLFQALLVSLSLVLAWRISRLLFGERAAFWTVSLQWLMPFRWSICLDLNHYIPGGFYFLSALWVLVEWSRGNPGVGRKWGLALCAGLLLPLMRLEGGIDQVYLASAAGVLLLQWASGSQNTRQTLQAALAWMAGPLLISTLLLPPLSARLDQANRHRLSSGTMAFVARGWMPETGGEYSVTYEQIDWLTPAASKQSMQASLLASQAFYNPWTLLFRLLPEKMAKYFLLGYASGAEEMLIHNGADTSARLAKGARIAYLLAGLPLMLWGGWLLLPLLRRTHRLCLVLPCVLFCAFTALVGETSPRYSIYIQPFLFMLGALPLAWSRQRNRLLFRSARAPGVMAAASLCILWLLMAGILFAARPWLQTHAVQDMRRWKTSPRSQSLDLPPTLAPFELHLPPASHAPSWGEIQLPLPAGQSAEFSFYILPMAGLSASRGTPAILRRQTAQGMVEEKLSLPARVTLALEAGDSRFFELLSPSTPPPFPLIIGYTTLRPAP